MSERSARLDLPPGQEPAAPALFQPWQSEPYVPPNPEPDENIRHSLFGEILDWMLAPLLLLWPMSIAITYLVAKSIANQPFDDALEDRVTVLSQQIRTVAGQPVVQLPGSARDVLRADDVDSVYFQISDPAGQHIDGDRDLPRPRDGDLEERGRSGAVLFRNDSIHGAPVRVAYSYVNLDPLRERGAVPGLALVQVAETLDKRAHLANEIIKGVILPQFIILPVILALVWFALSRGLSPLAELQQRIRARPQDDLSPIDPRQVPEEISPLVGSFNDMLERLAQTVEMQKRFIADAAHQMKTPLAGMRMQSELALRQVDPDEIHRSLEQLAKSSESATRLVNQLLALARAENQPHAGLAFEELDLVQLARATVQDWVQASFAHGIDLGYESPNGPPDDLLIAGNALMLRELLSNLIDNALRYTPRGGSVTVRVRRDGAHALLEVEDTGPGIAPAERAHVFERFYRILGTNVQGSGLGLAIVREIAQQHGAEIDIFNNPRSHSPKFPGSLFRLTFPPPVHEPDDAD
ncbi:sensor histidine kinase [Massilia yuzhufengensis]|uniref:histidine kinase n=1 Tax=Massilia yuzhufengensis TaxID=1164594 RepID=A0A1I1RG00_9BURK|nr:sensor histidine kinase [Massilia yuzhufengensis]SFD33274.1 signal transduction histidine kinase [Massilia yuzhufengensis]